MCNDYEQHVVRKAYCEMMQLLEWGVPARRSEADLPQADDIRITDLAPASRARGSAQPWGLPQFSGLPLTPLSRRN
jgi:hypothetical protein